MRSLFASNSTTSHIFGTRSIEQTTYTLNACFRLQFGEPTRARSSASWYPPSTFQVCVYCRDTDVPQLLSPEVELPRCSPSAYLGVTSNTHTHYRSTTSIPGPFSALISRTRCEPSPGHSWTFLLRGLPQSRGIYNEHNTTHSSSNSCCQKVDLSSLAWGWVVRLLIAGAPSLPGRYYRFAPAGGWAFGNLHSWVHLGSHLDRRSLVLWGCVSWEL